MWSLLESIAGRFLKHDGLCARRVSDESGMTSLPSFRDVPFAQADINEAWREFDDRYCLKKTMEFADEKIEADFQDHLISNKQSLKNNLMFHRLYGIVVLTFVFVDVFSPGGKEQYITHWFPAAIGVQLLLFFSSICYLLAHRLPCTRQIIEKHYNVISFGLMILAGLVYTLQLLMVVQRSKPAYGAHTAISILICVSVRWKWIWQVCTSFLFAILFLVTSIAGGYKLGTTATAFVFCVISVIVGFVTVYSLETDLRSVFKQQQFSIFLLNKHASVLEQLAKQAQSSEAIKSRFVANISHELRTPLHGVITSLDLLKSTNISKVQQSYIEAAETSSGLLLDILNNVLTISKLQVGKVTLDHSPVDLRTIMEGVTVVFNQISAKKGVEVISYVPPACPSRIVSDEVHLKQILFNLVSNAVKFTSKGHIVVSLKIENESERDVTLTFEVKDSGTGIAPEDTHLLFQRFSQVDASKTRKFQGTGLGLAIVFEFAKLFGGQMTVASEGLGHGTSFRFTSTFLKDQFNQKNNQSEPSFWDFSFPAVSLSEIPAPTDQAIPAFLLHSDRECCSIWNYCFSHVGLPPIDQCCDPDQFESIINKWLSSFGGSGSGEISDDAASAPICLIIDRSTVFGDLNWVQVLRRGLRMMQTAETPIRPFVFVILEDPIPRAQSPPGDTLIREMTEHHQNCGDDSPFVHILSLPKPCRLNKIEEIVNQIQNIVSRVGEDDYFQSESGDELLESDVTPILPENVAPPESKLLSSFISDVSEHDALSLVSMPPSTPPAAPSAAVEQSCGVGVFDVPKCSEDLGMKEVVACAVEPNNDILVVDDNSINRLLTERLLTNSGFRCVSVENGELAVTAATEKQFAVIFMDITMPVMDGCTATKLIRKMQDSRGCPRTFICALSAVMTDGENLDGFDSSDFKIFDHCLAKPIKSALLVEVARDLVEIYQKSN